MEGRKRSGLGWGTHSKRPIVSHARGDDSKQAFTCVVHSVLLFDPRSLLQCRGGDFCLFELRVRA
eukprot:3442944-Pyramimonas_sp.AAC.2